MTASTKQTISKVLTSLLPVVSALVGFVGVVLHTDEPVQVYHLWLPTALGVLAVAGIHVVTPSADTDSGDK